MIRVSRPVWELSAAWMNSTSITIDPTAPTSIRGLRTLRRSERMPKTMRATMSAHQNQALRLLAWAVDRLTPLGLLNTVDQ